MVVGSAGTGGVAPPLGVYVHVPFCPHKCFYCDFTAYIYREDRAAAYLQGVGKEAALLAAHPATSGRRPSTLYLGGGTPTALTGAELGSLVEGISGNYDFGAVTEATVEANPETLDLDKLTRLWALGFNRISIGLQAWDDDLLDRLGRRHTVRDFLDAYRSSRRAGFTNIGVDLIFALPGQSPAQWRDSLQRVIDLQPEHISTYSLQIEEGTAFHRWERQARFAPGGPAALPDEDEAVEMYMLARASLIAAGYEHYEISNFARPGFRSRHNLIYWHNGEYLGLGPGASSHLAGRRWTNHPRLDHYRESVVHGCFPWGHVEDLTEEREMSDTVILGLRLLEGVSLEGFSARFGRTVQQVFGDSVDRLGRSGLIRVAEGCVRLTERGLPVANRVFAEFLLP